MSYLARLMRHAGVRFRTDTTSVPGQPRGPRPFPRPESEFREIHPSGTGLPQVDPLRRNPAGGRPTDGQDLADRSASAKGEPRHAGTAVGLARHEPQAVPAPTEGAIGAPAILPKAASGPSASASPAFAPTSPPPEPGVSQQRAEAPQPARPSWPTRALGSEVPSRPALPEVVDWVEERSSAPDTGVTLPESERGHVPTLEDHAIVKAPPLPAGHVSQLQTEEAQTFSLHIGTIQLTLEDPNDTDPPSSGLHRESGGTPVSNAPSRLTRHYLRW
jgi:hypothetical protein